MNLIPMLVLLSLACNGLCSESSTAASSSTIRSSTAGLSSGGPASPDGLTVVQEELVATGSEAKNATEENVDFDFVNLPGYGVIDDANSTANASQFSCFNRRYGYYADVPKNCLMFHLCYPVQEPSTQEILFQRFSFVCSDNAIFDQQHLVCVDNETLSVKCADAPQYFGASNDRLIASLHQNAAGQLALSKDEDAGQDTEGTAELATESTVVEEIVLPINGTSEEDTAQYGVLLESLFGRRK